MKDAVFGVLTKSGPVFFNSVDEVEEAIEDARIERATLASCLAEVDGYILILETLLKVLGPIMGKTPPRAQNRLGGRYSELKDLDDSDLLRMFGLVP